MIKDMTVGNPSRILLGFSLPMILSRMFQQLYNIVDSVVAGQFAGVNALAAVGASYPVTMLFIAVATGAGMGSSVIISQLFGAKEYGRMKSAIYTALISMAALSALFTLLGLVFCTPLISLMGTPEAIFADSDLYLRIYVFGIFFLFIYNIVTAVFNALGDSRTPLFFLIFSSLFNVALDVWFVAGFEMGVAGVAWATFIAQGISSILSALWLFRKLQHIDADGKVKLFDWRLLGAMSKIAVPSIIQQSIVSIGQLGVQALVNRFDERVVAGYSAAIKIDSFLKVAGMSVSNAISSFTAQNIGAGTVNRIRKGRNAAILTMAVYSILAFAVIRLFGAQIVGVFVDSKESAADVIKVGVEYLNIVGMFYFACGVLLIFNGLLRGSGRVFAFTCATMTDLILRVGSAYLLADAIGPSAIWWSIPIGWCVAMVLAGCFYFFRRVDRKEFEQRKTQESISGRQ